MVLCLMEKHGVFTRICFGSKSSPNIADTCMVKVAKSGEEDYPYTAHVLTEKRYVDDIGEANSNLNIVLKTWDQTTELLGKFGFDIKKWLSNKAEVGLVKRDGKISEMEWKMSEMEWYLIQFTKRTILKNLAGTWDPLGTLCGVMMIGKLIFQSVVRMKTSWDTQI